MFETNFSLSERIANKLIINSTSLSSIGLMHGKTGCAIGLYGLYRKTDNKIYEEIADKLIDLVFEETNTQTMFGFSYGLAGIGCGFEYLMREKFVGGDDEVFEEIDEAVFQLDRKKFRQTEIFSDFYAPGLYYLMRTENKSFYQDKDAVRFLEYDLKNMFLSIEHSGKSSEISDNYLISVLITIIVKKHLFSSDLVDTVTESIKKRLDGANLNLVEKTALGNLSITEKTPNIDAEIENSDETDFLKTCLSYTSYNLFASELVAELQTPLQNRFDLLTQSETFRTKLFEMSLGLSGLSGFFPFITSENTAQLSECIENKEKNIINLYVFNEGSRASVYGIGTYINELTLCLKNVENINLNIVKLNDECKEFRIETDDGVKYWKIPAAGIHNGNDYEKQQKLYYQSVVLLLKQYAGTTDNMIAHFNYLQSLPLLNEMKKVFNCKTVLAIHYLNWCFALQGNLLRLNTIIAKNETDQDSFEKNIRKNFEQERRIFQETDSIICLAHYTSDLLFDGYEIPCKKTTVIYNGLHDVAHKISQTKINRLKQKYHIKSDENIIIFAGRLDPAKGLDILIEAFAKILKAEPKSRLIIAGDGNFGEYLKKGEYIWTKITFTGRIDRDKLFELYAIADIGVMPSTHEQCSYTAIEMMMHGLPLIVSATTGLSETVEENVSGFKIPVTEYKDHVEISCDLLAEKILYLLNEPKELRKMKKQCRKRYSEYYSAEIFKNNMLDMYRKLIR